MPIIAAACSDGIVALGFSAWASGAGSVRFGFVRHSFTVRSFPYTSREDASTCFSASSLDIFFSVEFETGFSAVRKTSLASGVRYAAILREIRSRQIFIQLGKLR